MKKLRPSKEAIAENLTRLMEMTPHLRTPELISAKCQNVSKRTVYNLKDGTYDPMKKIDAVAEVFGLEGWMLAYPTDNVVALQLLRVYNSTTDSGRKVIDLAVRGAEDVIPGAEKINKKDS